MSIGDRHGETPIDILPAWSSTSPPTPNRLLAEQALSRAAGAPLVGGNAVELLIDAQAHYDAWLAAIRGAQQRVLLENYIIRDDDDRARISRCAGRARTRRRIRRGDRRLDGLPGAIRLIVLEAPARGRRPGADLQSAAVRAFARMDEPRPSQAIGGRWSAWVSVRRMHQREMAG